jgi:hypothetical protein
VASIIQPSDYDVSFVNGTLTVAKASLIVKADDKTISEDDRLPRFTSTITGFINGDLETIICGPSYYLNPTYRGNPGTYKIIPYGLKIENQDFYDIKYIAGSLYVTEKDDCDHDDRKGKGNSNKNNRSTLSSTVKTGNINNSDKPGVFDKSGKLSIVDETNMLNQAEVYPNPTSGKVTIQLNSINLSEKNIIITDAVGKVYSSKVVTGIDGNRLELNISSFKSGVYFIKVKIDGANKTFKILKL